jgi:prevent-host-death family protein
MPETRATVRDLRNHGGDVLDRVAAGERVVVTRDGRPVAELTAVRGAARLGRAALLARWRHLPRVDAATLRRDLDDLLDPDA